MAGRRRSIGSSCSKELAKNGTSSTTESPAQNRRLATQDTGRYGRGPEIAMSTNKSRRSRGQARSALIDLGIMAAKSEGQWQAYCLPVGVERPTGLNSAFRVSPAKRVYPAASISYGASSAHDTRDRHRKAVEAVSNRHSR